MWAISLVVMLGVAGMSMFMAMRRANSSGASAMSAAEPAPMALHAMAPVEPPKVAAVAPAPPSAPGPLDQAAIRKVIVAGRPALVACAKGASIKAALTLKINSRGKVTKATVTGKPASVARCMTSAARRWTFPRGTDETTVNVPIVVDAGGEHPTPSVEATAADPLPPPPAPATLNRATLRDALVAHQGELAACTHGAAARATVTLTISARGDVTKASVTGPAEAIASCMTTVARRWTFPAGSGDTTVGWPVTIDASPTP